MKLFKTLFFVVLSFVTINTFGQTESDGLVKQVNLSILYPGVSAELPISENFSVVGKAGIAGSFAVSGSTGTQTEFYYVLAPAYSFQSRFYYNGLKSETRKGKALFGNSGNYGFLQFSGNFDAILSSIPTNESEQMYGGGLGWGLQRMYGNKVLVSWGIGLGYYSTGQVSSIGEFTLAYNLFTEK